jgi:hypothetical protein
MRQRWTEHLERVGKTALDQQIKTAFRKKLERIKLYIVLTTIHLFSYLLLPRNLEIKIQETILMSIGEGDTYSVGSLRKL